LQPQQNLSGKQLQHFLGNSEEQQPSFPQHLEPSQEHPFEQQFTLIGLTSASIMQHDAMQGQQ